MNLKQEGKLVVSNENHAIEYDADSMVGGGTVFLAVANSRDHKPKHMVPVFVNHIDDLIDLLGRGKDLIQAVESDQ